MSKKIKNVNLQKVSCYSNGELLQLKKALTESLTNKHTGKMHGMQSLSTSCLFNPFCKKRRRDQSTVCSQCYAVAHLNFRANNQPKYKNNIKLWCTEKIPYAALPDLNNILFRFESFGDLLNTTQAENYMRLAEKNSLVSCALWTKNDFILADLFSRRKKPDNLKIVKSALRVNVPEKKTYAFVDKIFNVFSGKYAAANNVKITCGGRSCIECGKCYLDDSDTISELLKNDQTKKEFKPLLEF